MIKDRMQELALVPASTYSANQGKHNRKQADEAVDDRPRLGHWPERQNQIGIKISERHQPND